MVIWGRLGESRAGLGGDAGCRCVVYSRIVLISKFSARDWGEEGWGKVVCTA